jgi:hypothetical protein
MVLSLASVALSTLWRSPMPGFTTVFETLFDLFFLPLPLFLPFPFLFFFTGLGKFISRYPIIYIFVQIESMERCLNSRDL